MSTRLGVPGPAGMTGGGLAEQVGVVSELCNEIIRNVEQVVHGKSAIVRQVVVCLLAQGHVLIEDVPGVAKTTLAKALARSIDGTVRRIQFTPDLLPSDVVGVQTYHQETGTFPFVPGPVFANVVIADEINRASPKTQSALLETMGEGQVTIGGESRALPDPNMVIATQNPHGYHGTYPLPEAQVDRFMMRISMGYPQLDHEVDLIGDALRGHAPDALRPVASLETLRRAIQITRHVHVRPVLGRYIAEIAASTRTSRSLRLGMSPRASAALALAARANAAIDGRVFACVEDVHACISPVLAHRVQLTAEAISAEHTAASVVEEIVSTIAVPDSRAVR